MSFLLDARPNMGRQQKSHFSFPPLKVAEIKECLNALGIKVSEAELTEPENHKDVIRRMLEHLAEICTGTTRDEMGQMAFAGISVLNYPELHEESIPQLNSFRAVVKMMEICGVQDFTTKDFMAPSAKRLKRHLSGIINFAKFREERWAIMNDLTTTRDTLIDRSSTLKDQNEKLNSHLAHLREKTAEEAKVIARVEGECSTLETGIKTLNAKQSEIREEIAELKSFNNSLKEGIAARNVQLEEAQNERASLRGQIVNSPERFRKQIVDVGQALQAEQRDTKAAEKKLRELSGWLAHVEEAQAEVDLALHAMREVRAEVERQKSCVGELKAQQEHSHAMRNALQDLDQNTHQITRQATRNEEKLAHLRRQASSRSTDSTAAVEDLHRQLVEAENFRVQVRSRSERAEGEVLRQEREAEAEAQALEQEHADMVAAYQVCTPPSLFSLSSSLFQCCSPRPRPLPLPLLHLDLDLDPRRGWSASWCSTCRACARASRSRRQSTMPEFFSREAAARQCKILLCFEVAH